MCEQQAGDIRAPFINLTEDEFMCKVVKNFDEGTQVVESGFDYVADMDGCRLFKERK